MLDITDSRQTHLSASSVNDYIDCGLLYKLSRIDKIRPEFDSDAWNWDRNPHDPGRSLRGKNDQEKLLLKQIQESFAGFWRELAEDNLKIQYAEGKDFDTLLREGKELLAVWYGKLPENDHKVIAVEEPFILNLRQLDIPLIGFIDSWRKMNPAP